MKKMNKRILAMLLAIVTIVSLFPLTVFADPSAEDDIFAVRSSGAVVTSVELPQNDKVTLTADAATSYQWQILAGTTWVNIAGANSASIDLTYAMVANLLSGNSASVRCKAVVEDAEEITEPVTVSVIDPVFESKDVEINVDPVILEEAVVSQTAHQYSEEEIKSLYDAAAAAQAAAEEAYAIASAEGATAEQIAAAEAAQAAADEAIMAYMVASGAAPMTLAAGDEEEVFYTVTIHYVFAHDNTKAADDVVASFPKGSSPSIKSPVIEYFNASQLNVSFENISADAEVTVTYSAVPVDVTVRHHYQNANDDGYAAPVEEVIPCGASLPVGDDLYNTLEGFYAHLYDVNTIPALDGSTVINIYYDRLYYLVTFDISGGYGVEPVYGRYGSTIGEIGTPVRAGYTFTGWYADAGCTNPVADITAQTINGPATYYAGWDMVDSAKVTINYWGENADDTDYSLYFTKQIDATPGATITVNPEHVHTDECGVTCGFTEHTHSDSCWELVPDSFPDCPHTHAIGCYAISNRSSSQDYPFPGDFTTEIYKLNSDTPFKTVEQINQAYQNGQNVNGQYKFIDEETWHYTVFFDGWWYYSNNYSSRIKEYKTTNCSHTHNMAIGGCAEYKLVCTINDGIEHLHTNDCGATCGTILVYDVTTDGSVSYDDWYFMDPVLWTLVGEGGSATVEADGSSVINVYFNRTSFTLNYYKDNVISSDLCGSITAKWGANISKEFLAIASDTGYNLWYNTANHEVVSNLVTMPPEHRDYISYGNDDEGANHFLQDLKGDYGVDANLTVFVPGGGSISPNDYYNYDGFTFSHIIIGGTTYYEKVTGRTFQGSEFYYSRNRYDLIINDGKDNVYIFSEDADTYPNRVGRGILFEQPLTVETLNTYLLEGKTFDLDLEVPDTLDPNGYEFDGFYTNDSYSGDEFKIGEYTVTNADGTTATKTNEMPADNVILYAKWTKKTHNVNVYKDNTLTESLMDEQRIKHLELATAPEAPTKEGLSFVGWFYMDGTTEKAFTFDMAVTKSMNLYAKWTTSNAVPYTVHYQLADGTPVADDLTGSALGGSTNNFKAKAGSQLYAGYRDTYMPDAITKSMTLDPNGENVLTFIYSNKATSYTVKYLEKDTNEQLAEPRTFDNVTEAIVFPTYKVIPGYIPDAVQKRLELSSNAEENVVTFYYTEDNNHAPVHVILHYEDLEYADVYHTEEYLYQGVVGERYRYEIPKVSEPYYTNSLPDAMEIHVKVQNEEGNWITLNMDDIDAWYYTYIEHTVPASGLIYEVYFKVYYPIPLHEYHYAVAENGALTLLAEDHAETHRGNTGTFGVLTDYTLIRSEFTTKIGGVDVPYEDIDYSDYGFTVPHGGIIAKFYYEAKTSPVRILIEGYHNGELTYTSDKVLSIQTDSDYTYDAPEIPGYTFDSGKVYNQYIEGAPESGGIDYSDTTKTQPVTDDGLTYHLIYTTNNSPGEVTIDYVRADNANISIRPQETASPTIGSEYTVDDTFVSGYSLSSARALIYQDADKTTYDTVEISDLSGISAIVGPFGTRFILYYTQKAQVTVTYAVCDEGSGTLSAYSEQVHSGENAVNGSQPTAADNYVFVGWFKDQAATDPVDESWVAADNTLMPKDVIGNVTYYAKFELNQVKVEYEVWEQGGGTVDQAEEMVTIGQNAQGATAAASDYYTFVGWYDNEECSGTPVSVNATFAPENVTEAKTYYAKFTPYADLIIKKTGGSGQHIVRVYDANNVVVARVVVTSDDANGVKITGLPIGQYTVIEDAGWSWRYSASYTFNNSTGNSGTVVTGENTVNITNGISKSWWLNHTDYENNEFKK